MILETLFYICLALIALYFISKRGENPRKKYNRSEMIKLISESRVPPMNWSVLSLIKQGTEKTKQKSSKPKKVEVPLEDKENSEPVHSKMNVLASPFNPVRNPFTEKPTEFNPLVEAFVPASFNTNTSFYHPF